MWQTKPRLKLKDCSLSDMYCTRSVYASVIARTMRFDHTSTPNLSSSDRFDPRPRGSSGGEAAPTRPAARLGDDRFEPSTHGSTDSERLNRARGASRICRLDRLQWMDRDHADKPVHRSIWLEAVQTASARSVRLEATRIAGGLTRPGRFKPL